MEINKVNEKVLNNERLSAEESFFLYTDADFFSLGKLANSIQEKKHPQNSVTFIVDSNITFTNVCISGCKFCAFYCKPTDSKAFVLSTDEILKKISELVNLGGTQVMLQGGLNPKLDLDYYVNLCRKIKENFNIHLHSFSPPEIDFLSKKHKKTHKEVLETLQKAGLDSMPGGGAEILVDEVRSIVSPNKINSQTWFEVMKSAHEIGMKTTATMVYGLGETIEQRIEHLMKIRELQDKTNGFRAFIPWSFSPKNTELEENRPSNGGGIEYLKMVALSRIVLDNIDNIQAGWVTEGPKMAQLALAFGANDLGGILIEEVVVASTGVAFKMNKDDMIYLIKSAGKIPAQRNTKYEIVRVFY
jgi:cyclic dehypoxanthinyl futalosine synthase